MHKKQEIIIRSFHDGESKSRIAREVGVCRKTVRNYISAYSEEKKKLQSNENFNDKELIEEIVKAPKYNCSNRKKRKITDEIVKSVKDCLAENRKKKSRGQHKQQMKKIDILEHLREQGFDIGYTSICGLVNSLENIHSETYIKQKYSPGEICEFDWAEVKLFIAGKLRTFQQAVFTSAYGNYRYSYLFPKQNTQCFQEAHALFFEHLGGVFRTIVYDNMKVTVRKFVGRNEKEATRGLLQLSMYYNFDFRFCNIRAGNEKGHVERSVEYVRRKAFSRKDNFSSLEEANEHLLSVCEVLNRKPQKGNKEQSAIELFEIEKEYLLPVFQKFECARLADLRVDKYGTIIVDSCHYSVPENYTGKIITAKIYSSEIICFFEDEKICIHKKSHRFGEWIIKIEHYLQTLKRKPGAVRSSVALSQMKEGFQNIYRKYFSAKSRDFIELLIYMKENNLSLPEVQTIICKLEKLCPSSISTVKIKTIIERNEEEYTFPKTSRIEKISMRQLSDLNQLMPHKNNLTASGGIL